MAFNIVELAASVDGDDDCAFDQRCRFGHRVEDHAVYCHNDDWDDSPRKCRRSWYSNGRIKDEDCPAFQPNPEFKGEMLPTPTAEPLCSRCGGRKIVNTDRGKIETCPLCAGSGSQPVAIGLSTFEQDTLEIGSMHDGHIGAAAHAFVRIAENDRERESIDKLCSLDLVELRSVTFSGDVSAYLLENTLKGEAVMRANWKAEKQ